MQIPFSPAVDPCKHVVKDTTHECHEDESTRKGKIDNLLSKYELSKAVFNCEGSASNNCPYETHKSLYDVSTFCVPTFRVETSRARLFTCVDKHAESKQRQNTSGINDDTMYEHYYLYYALILLLLHTFYTKHEVSHATTDVSKCVLKMVRSYHTAMKHVLLYVNETRNLADHDLIVTCTLYSTCYAGFAGNPDTCRRRSGWVYMLCGAAPTWRLMTQSVCNILTANSEMNAARAAVTENKYVHGCSVRFNLYQKDPAMLFEDNG